MLMQHAPSKLGRGNPSRCMPLTLPGSSRGPGVQEPSRKGGGRAPSWGRASAARGCAARRPGQTPRRRRAWKPSGSRRAAADAAPRAAAERLQVLGGRLVRRAALAHARAEQRVRARAHERLSRRTAQSSLRKFPAMLDAMLQTSRTGPGTAWCGALVVFSTQWQERGALKWRALAGAAVLADGAHQQGDAVGRCAHAGRLQGGSLARTCCGDCRRGDTKTLLPGVSRRPPGDPLRLLPSRPLRGRRGTQHQALCIRRPTDWEEKA